jgi:type I restriction enzyme M protein
MERARVLAVVGLHVNTFKPFTGTKTSVVFARKWEEGETPPDDYPIFMAVNERPVKDNRGNYIYRRNADGSWGVDPAGKRLIDHDLDDIADSFIEFAKDQDSGFWPP